MTRIGDICIRNFDGPRAFRYSA